MEAVRTSETSVNICQTILRSIPEDSRLHTRRRGNLKSHHVGLILSEPLHLTLLAENCGKSRT
jgi:hypothetical protein